ncbi:ABC transporter permease [Paraburkholderia phenazinium]|uniref:NitT/TauT family transport system permease protein n=1 Tax=Paraburkholderia phenazinium TaxID=60549 RepID=A0A1N6J0F0_9BURK|nr:ABC transporter permease [Paraburkholderia phenazinium]SIO37742.1 NitT/TauT family transport system permease protein [Paraburkholderia phenazinium]
MNGSNPVNYAQAPVLAATISTDAIAARTWQAAAARVLVDRIGDFVAFGAVVCVVWAAISYALHAPDYVLPTPTEVAAALVANGGLIAGATWLTLWCTVVGIAVSVCIAVGLALLFVLSPLADRTVTPLLIAIRSIPMIAITPLVVVLFGRDRWNTIGMVALLTFFQVMLAAKRGFDAPSQSMLELMRTCGASFWQTLLKVRVPSAVPFVFTGLRLAGSSAILCAMFAEWLSGSPGLGTLMLDAYSKQNLGLMWAAVAVSTTLAYLFFTLTIALERAVLDRSGT